ncbi:hypothetical protein BJ508DRAFT_330159 [Ascobolus immersus RN42]|uniref:Uncharacterized protein n=1 Tax=Ascobolus immersus RN42 TaxID=1160509 RepID=A0A3N4HW61_ASCIM|nr:hypothetical protein BJ508DRAFT_330159 [Ascobolus immersus RN42]
MASLLQPPPTTTTYHLLTSLSKPPFTYDLARLKTAHATASLAFTYLTTLHLHAHRLLRIILHSPAAPLGPISPANFNLPNKTRNDCYNVRSFHYTVAAYMAYYDAQPANTHRREMKPAWNAQALEDGAVEVTAVINMLLQCDEEFMELLGAVEEEERMLWGLLKDSEMGWMDRLMGRKQKVVTTMDVDKFWVYKWWSTASVRCLEEVVAVRKMEDAVRGLERVYWGFGFGGMEGEDMLDVESPKRYARET